MLYELEDVVVAQFNRFPQLNHSRFRQLHLLLRTVMFVSYGAESQFWANPGNTECGNDCHL